MSTGWTNIQHLREMTKDSPGIFAGSWMERCKDGWRWEVNLYIKRKDTKDRIREFIDQYGIANVSVGHPFNSEIGLPHTSKKDMVGIYINDQSELTFTLYRDLDRWERADPDNPFGEE